MTDSLFISSTALADLRARVPLVHHITNLVTINECANICLCLGASPVMSDDQADALELTALSGSLVLNQGTLNPTQVESMLACGALARSQGLPVVFDPVGAGATASRNTAAARIMQEVRPTIIKGNIGEVKFLAGAGGLVRGVDSLDTGEGGLAAVAALALQQGCVVCATGRTDLVSDGQLTVAIRGGCAELGRICGTGCMISSLIGAFAAVQDSPLTAAVLGCLAMKRAGELALDRLMSAAATAVPTTAIATDPESLASRAGQTWGLASFRVALFDALQRLDDAGLEARFGASGRLEVYHA